MGVEHGSMGRIDTNSDAEEERELTAQEADDADEMDKEMAARYKAATGKER